ncbi:hypothetical protein [Rhodococcus rhodochrous]|uniref:hypothetical protein n=1 Tax=Rhodococcus rhodochrous TaxID=1829 RepID=UPI001782C72E|nr:hypothetical protein [Rhodococcus rhodochrous]
MIIALLTCAGIVAVATGYGNAGRPANTLTDDVIAYLAIVLGVVAIAIAGGLVVTGAA